jgi:cellulose synthase/poly-beta-1,6-N-acetylglucosamine synthase-like glycosyltransferase
MDTGIDFSLSLLLCSNCVIAINFSWIAIFILMRSNYLVPAIDCRLKNAQIKAVSLSSASGVQQSVENVIGPSNGSSHLSSISFPFISIIVPARNEEKNIKKCLLSILNQNYPNFEVLAIDDSSTDNTLQIMNKIKENVRDTLRSINRLKVISLSRKPEGWTGKAWASHQGYLHAKGKILVFTDADTCFFNKDAILYAISYLQDQKLDVLTGHARIELIDFWSKAIMPLWDLFSIILEQNPSAVNNTQSRAAYLVGSLYIIDRRVIRSRRRISLCPGSDKRRCRARSAY